MNLEHNFICSQTHIKVNERERETHRKSLWRCKGFLPRVQIQLLLLIKLIKWGLHQDFSKAENQRVGGGGGGEVPDSFVWRSKSLASHELSPERIYQTGSLCLFQSMSSFGLLLRFTLM